jgi:hypothetical protein
MATPTASTDYRINHLYTSSQDDFKVNRDLTLNSGCVGNRCCSVRVLRFERLFWRTVSGAESPLV